MQLPPLSLYVHIPWCVRKCPYCDFNSHESTDIPEAAYVEALCKDLASEQEYLQGRRLQSVFIGGGTPSLFSATAIENILAHAEKVVGFESAIEITLEANPGTVEQARFQGYHAAGVNRLSIGIQSFNDRHLKALGRIHDSSSAIKAVDSARRAGFDNFNLDLMHGLPDQSLPEALADLEQALALGPTHLSWYQLTIEPNTAFYKAPPLLPQEDRLADIYHAGRQTLADGDFLQYEISAYSQSGRQSRHNLNYWQFGDYLGIGAGAHGKISLPHSDHIIRTAKTRTPRDYLARTGNFIASQTTIEPEERPLEFLMNALRLVDGVDTTLLEERAGVVYSNIEVIWAKLVDKGLLQPADRRLSTTPLGFNFLNEVLEAF
jgi:putative oxygen-independent coproporphyrinogen III oxidase